MNPARWFEGFRRGAAVGLAATLIVAAAGLAPAVAEASSPSRDGEHAPGRVLVRFAEGATKATKARAREAGEARTLHAYGLVRGLELLATPLPVDVAIERLGRMPGVEYAEPDLAVRAVLTPNDPGFPSLWGLDQPSDADIDAQAAWNTTTGGPSTVVAVIDTGTQLDHPDLAANIWTNPGEVPGNGIDDDDDGYVDDVHGWDFVADDADPNDEHGHGTHVSGTIAAVGNNRTGVVGVAFGSRIMPLRILDEDGTGYVSDAVRAFEYASKHGARISNNSWGAIGGASQPLYDAVEAAGARGQLVVAAAGNDGIDIDQVPFYPAAIDLPNVVSVAAMTKGDELAPFSNYGTSSVDVAAPGSGILSTWIGGGYAYNSGTSMATPHVSGVAALVLSLHPTWSVAQVRDRILRTARPVDVLESVVTSGGMVNAAAAVASTPNLAPAVTITKPAGGSSVLPGTKVTFSATAVDPEQGNVAASIHWVSSLMGEIGTGATISRSDLLPGTHVIAAIARDSAGHRPLAAIQLRVGPELRTIAEGGDLRAPVVAVSAGGTPVVAWTERGIGTVVSRLTGGTWSREVVSHAYLDAWPDLGVEPDGTVRLFVQRDWADVGVYGDNGILAATDDGGGAGSGWTVERVSEACGDAAELLGCGEDRTPAWGRDASGVAHLAWIRSPVIGAGNGPGIWHAREHANGTWTAERVLALASGAYGLDLAAGPGDAVHLSFVRADAGNEGVYHATDETGSWVVTRLSSSTTPVGWTRLAVSAPGVVDVAWGSADGLFVRTRTSGAWAAPATVTGDRVGSIDFVRDGGSLHLVFGRTDDASTGTGVAYATNGGGGWTITELDAGQDAHPRIAVDGAGHVHVSYLRAWPAPEIRHVTDATGSWVTDVVARGWAWQEPAFAVDAAGVRHVAVGRAGTEAGLWYVTDDGGSWSMSRVTSAPPDGQVGLAVGPDGTASIAWADAVAPDGTPLPDPAVRVTIGRPGAWTTTRIGDNAGSGTHAIARDAAGHLHLAFGVEVAGAERIAYATNASGSWVVTPVTPGPSDRDPSIAVDAAGGVHVAYSGSGAVQPIGYATDAGGAWAASVLTSGTPWDWRPSIAVDPSGRPRIAFGRENGGVRLMTFDGATWSTRVLSSNPSDVQPSVAVDDVGRTHVLYARASPGNGVCLVPLCTASPGLRYWTDAAGLGSPARVTDHGDDASPALVRGLDGGVSAAFVSPSWRLAEIRLQRPLPTATAPVVQLTGSGKLDQGRVKVRVRFSGSGATSYRLQLSTNSGSWATVGSVSSSTSRVVKLKPGSSRLYRFRVVPYAAGGLVGASMTGTSFRVRMVGERSGSIAYRGTWRTVRASSYYGGRARYATARRARASLTFTGREVTWIAARGPTRGKARVYIDGTRVATINLRASTTSYRRIAFRWAFGSSGTHTIAIRPTGSGRVDLDGLVILR